MKVDPKSFGRFLRQLHENKDYSINQLALYSGISAAHISRLERGLRPIPSPDTIRKLAKPLGITYQGILEAAGQLLARENHRETAAAIDQELERLKQTRMKYERALDRLERAYLFEDGGMSEKDYLVKRAELKDKLQEIDENIRSKWAGNGRDTKLITIAWPAPSTRPSCKSSYGALSTVST